VSNKPHGPRSSCRSPGGGRCGCTPPCSWAPPGTTGTQHWGSASAPSVPGQTGRAPAADTHMHLSWNVCHCVHALYQVKGERHQLQTHTHTHTHTHSRAHLFCNICRCVTRYQVKREEHQLHTDIDTDTHLCNGAVPGQMERAPNAHRYGQRESDTDTDTHAQTCISLCMYKHCHMQCPR